MFRNRTDFLLDTAMILAVLSTAGIGVGLLWAAQDTPRHGAPHVKDPAECRMYCHPPGYEGERPKDINPEAQGYACEGSMCAKAEHGSEQCQEHVSCNVNCSEVCCVCLRECI